MNTHNEHLMLNKNTEWKDLSQLVMSFVSTYFSEHLHDSVLVPLLSNKHIWWNNLIVMLEIFMFFIPLFTYSIYLISYVCCWDV